MFDPVGNKILKLEGKGEESQLRQRSREQMTADVPMDSFLVHTGEGEVRVMHKSKWPRLTVANGNEGMEKLQQVGANKSQESMGEGEVDQGQDGGEQPRNMVTALDEADEMEGSEAEMVGEDVGMKAQRKFFPVVAARKSSRGRKAMQRSGGMHKIPPNSFAILNSYEDDDLESIAKSCDIILGGCEEEIAENINAIKLEEIAKAAVAEANYKHRQELVPEEKHSLEGENLNLEKVDNQQRGCGNVSPSKRGGGKKSRGDRLSRELKRISYK
jgi:hypothetical protein